MAWPDDGARATMRLLTNASASARSTGRRRCGRWNAMSVGERRVEYRRHGPYEKDGDERATGNASSHAPPGRPKAPPAWRSSHRAPEWRDGGTSPPPRSFNRAGELGRFGVIGLGLGAHSSSICVRRFLRPRPSVRAKRGEHRVGDLLLVDRRRERAAALRPPDSSACQPLCASDAFVAAASSLCRNVTS